MSAEGSDAFRPPSVISRVANENEIGRPALATEADDFAHRSAEGRFYAVGVGQFKSGRSTLLNALAGCQVLPPGLRAKVQRLLATQRGSESDGGASESLSA